MKNHSQLRAILLLLAFSASAPLLHADAESSFYEQLPRLQADRIANWQSITWRIDGKKVKPTKDSVVVLGKAPSRVHTDELAEYSIHLDRPVTVFNIELNEDARWLFTGKELTLETVQEPFSVYGSVTFNNDLDASFILVSPESDLRIMKSGSLRTQRLELTEGSHFECRGKENYVMSLEVREAANAVLAAGKTELGDLILHPHSSLTIPGMQIYARDTKEKAVKVLEYNRFNGFSMFSPKCIESSVIFDAKLRVDEQGVLLKGVNLVDSTLNIESEASLRGEDLLLGNSFITVDEGTSLAIQNLRLQTDNGKITRYNSKNPAAVMPLLSIKAFECHSSDVCITGSLFLSVALAEGSKNPENEPQLAIVLRGLPLRCIKSELSAISVSVNHQNENSSEWRVTGTAEGENGNAVFILKKK